MQVTPGNLIKCVEILETGVLRDIAVPEFIGFPFDMNSSNRTVSDLPLPFQGAIIKNLTGYLPDAGQYEHILSIPLSDLFKLD